MLDAMSMGDTSSNGPKRNGEQIKIPFLEKGFQINLKDTKDVDKIIDDGGGGAVGLIETQKNKWYKKEMGLFKKVSC
ncbi:unnamed protein product [Diamesa hyperborea]